MLGILHHSEDPESAVLNSIVVKKPCLGLTAVLVHGDHRSGGRVVTANMAKGRYLDDVVADREQVVGDAMAFMANEQHTASWEVILKQ